MSASPRLIRSVLSVVLLGLAVLPLHALDARLHSHRATDVAQVNAHLKRAEANLELVNGSIGHLTEAPKGSAGKLARVRLDQAFGDVEAARKLLEGLEGEGVAEAAARHKAARELYDKLDGILSGETPKPAPEGEEPEATEDPPKQEKSKGGEKQDPAKPSDQRPATVKLGYPHADNFKNTLFTLRRVEGDLGGVMKLLEELRPVTDQLSIQHRTVAGAVATITETRRQAGFVKDGLAKIPKNGEGVAEAQERLAGALASLDTAEAYLQPLNAQLAKFIDPANYPEFQSDVKRLRELSAAYANPELLFRDQRSRAAEALTQGEAAKAECIRIGQVYARLMEQGTEQGKSIEAAGNNFLGQYEAFLAAAAQQKASLPADIRADLAEADRMANEAVQNQKPLWFTGGIPQRLEWVDDKFALYTALDPNGAATLGQEVEAMKTSLDERANSLRELIIRENPLPNDTYAGVRPRRRHRRSARCLEDPGAGPRAPNRVHSLGGLAARHQVDLQQRHLVLRRRVELAGAPDRGRQAEPGTGHRSAGQRTQGPPEGRFHDRSPDAQFR